MQFYLKKLIYWRWKIDFFENFSLFILF